MRAARVLDMLLILQRRGRSTAGFLAEQLEVSERTILRDVEALSEAGVPIYTMQGSMGGIELLEGFQTNLTGLTDDEAKSLLLVGQPLLAHRLGLGAPVRSTREKLLNALPDALAAQAETLDEWFVHDPDPWRGNRIPHGELRRIAGAVQRRRIVELILGDRDDVFEVRPLGLVLKAGDWQLVHLASRSKARNPEVLPLDDLRSTRLTVRAFERPLGFDLIAFWKQHLAAELRGVSL